MSPQFSDFLAAHADRIAELAAPRLVGSPSTPVPAGTPGARQLINAVLVAMSADDLRPLTTFYRLDDTDGLSDRLSAAIQDVQAIRVAVLDAASEMALAPERRLALGNAAIEEAGALLSVVALQATRTLERRLRSVSGEASARGTSVSVTMHELRRPLTILNSYAQLLSTGMLGALPETALVAIEGITASTEMMVRMVNSLSELARLEDPDDRMSREVLTADEIVHAAVEPVSIEARLRGTTVEADVQPGVRVRGDRRRLVLALTNLLSNAVKHGPADSTVELRVTARDGDAHFVVRDHGNGFPPEDAEHLFDKYFRSVAERHRKVPGSGLGLYIVKTVVQRHGGRATACSIPGNGAEFEMIIPMHAEEQ